MTSRERVLHVLNRLLPDRLPVDIWLTPEVLTSLKSHVGEPDELLLYQKLGLDKVVCVSPGYDADFFDPNLGGDTDPWGVPLRRVQAGKATYQEYGTGPLATFESPSQLDDYKLWPDPGRFNYAAAKTAASRAQSLGFAIIGPWISHFEIYCHLRGMENALMDVLMEPDFLNATLDRIESIQTTMLERYLETLGSLVDIVFISDDMGTQASLLVSIGAWQQFFRPRLIRWVDLIHRHNKKVLFHTDGAARDLVPHLIDAGIDILNPIQHICPGMDRAALKRDFGSKVIFHGGVENQHVLPFGTVEDVRSEVKTCLETLGAGGGYIPCSCHNIQAGTPVENILAMIETVHQWKP